MTNVMNGSMLTLPLPIRDASPASVQMLRERCTALGLPTWRCDSAGVILQEPMEKGTLAILMGSRPTMQMIAEHAKAWGKQESPEVVQMFPGCWGIPLAEFRRRDRIGTIVAMAIGPEALRHERFLHLCQAAHLDAQATRRAMLPRAHFDELSARTTRDLLLFMANDLKGLEQHDHTALGFTRQLTDCYETINLLFSLGKSMVNLEQPEEFITGACLRLFDTLSFGFAGACFIDDIELGASISGRVFTSGEMTVDGPRLREALLAHAQAEGPVIMTALGGEPLPGAGQVLALPVMRSGERIGFYFAGDKRGDDNQVSSYDIQLFEAAAGFTGAFLDNAVLYAAQQRLFLGTLEALTASIDAKDRYTCGHSQRVAHIAAQLARTIGYTAEQADRVRVAGLVHDVGKIGVPEAVLTKGGKLTDEEFEWIKKHPEIGHRILKDIPNFTDVLPGVLHHHERWDGRGYPHKIAADSIPMVARLLALADTFDAMSSNRSYRAALPREKVLAEVERCAGSQFDPALVPAFLKLDFAEYDRMVAQAAAQPAYSMAA